MKGEVIMTQKDKEIIENFLNKKKRTGYRVL